MLRFSGGRVPRGLAHPLPVHLNELPTPSDATRGSIALAMAGIVAMLSAAPCFASLGQAPSTFAGTNAKHQARVLAASAA